MAASQQASKKKRIKISFEGVGGPSFPNNLETSYELKLQGFDFQQNNWVMDFASIPDKENMSFGDGLELYIPANERFGFLSGTKH